MDTPLSQIGQKLKAAREAQGLTLRNIYEKTKIPITHLQGIDTGIDEDLPEPVYVAGYIRRYAELVGLDGHMLSEEYRAAVGGKNGNGRKSQVIDAPYAPPINIHREKSRSLVDAPPTIKTIFFNALCVMGVIGLISYLTMTQLNNQANQADPTLTSLGQSAANFNNRAVQQTGPGGATIEGAANSDGQSRISLSASQHVWVEVKSVASGDSIFTGYLEQGDRRDYSDAQGLRVRADNGGSLTVAFDGKNETFGDAGKVAERTFMAKTINPTETTQAQAPAATTVDVKPAVVRRPTRAAQASTESRRERTRSIDDSPRSDYIPGESIGGGATRSIDVPYRYSEGRLDSE